MINDGVNLTALEAEALLRQMARTSAPANGKPHADEPTHAAAQLRKAEARYRTLVEEIPAVTFMAALDDGINELYVSPQIETMLGFSQKQWLEDPVLWYRQLHPDDRVRWHTEFAQTCSRGSHFRSEYRFL